MAAAWAEAPQETEQPVSQICFSRHIDSFAVGEEDSIIVRKGRRQYRLDLHPCPGLAHAETIKTESFGSCLGVGDRIIGLRHGARGPLESMETSHCWIKALYELRPQPTEP